MNYHDDVIARSWGRCEGMVFIEGRYSRCFREGVEVHHMLTRSRGGKILDAYGERDHLIALCPQHHRVAHEPDGYSKGLMINGYVTTGADGVPVYEGSDPRLRHLRSRSVGVSELLQDSSSTGPSEGL